MRRERPCPCLLSAVCTLGSLNYTWLPPWLGFLSCATVRGAHQADLSKLANLGVAFCLPKGYRIGGIMDYKQVKFDMLQLALGGGGGVWRKDSLAGEKYRALMSSTKYSPKLLEDM